MYQQLNLMNYLSKQEQRQNHAYMLLNRPEVGEGAEQYKGPPLFLWGSSSILGSLCPPPEERRLSMPEIGKKERNYYLFEIIQTKVL